MRSTLSSSPKASYAKGRTEVGIKGEEKLLLEVWRGRETRQRGVVVGVRREERVGPFLYYLDWPKTKMPLGTFWVKQHIAIWCGFGTSDRDTSLGKCFQINFLFEKGTLSTYSWKSWKYPQTPKIVLRPLIGHKFQCNSKKGLVKANYG